MKGKAQLYWSTERKAVVGVIEATDEELAEEGATAPTCWACRCCGGTGCAMQTNAPTPLEAARAGGWPAVFLAELQKRPPPKRGPNS